MYRSRTSCRGPPRGPLAEDLDVALRYRRSRSLYPQLSLSLSPTPLILSLVARCFSEEQSRTVWDPPRVKRFLSRRVPLVSSRQRMS